MPLDNPQTYAKLDKHYVADSMLELPLQIAQVLKEAKKIKVPKSYKNITQVVINGMGGSNLGTYLLKSAFADRLKVPVSLEPGYTVPASVNNKTLYIISSYSGTTEEPLSVYQEVKRRGAKIMAITEDSSKSKLLKIMERDNVPGYIFTPEFNPSEQPRLGTGYSIFGKIFMLKKAGVINFTNKEMEAVVEMLIMNGQKLEPEIATAKNPAKKLALRMQDKINVLVAAEHLRGNLQVAKNQINECSKAFAAWLEIPDMNHYAMEGLVHPAVNQKHLQFLFFDSELYLDRDRRRMQLTKQVVKKNKVAVLDHKLKQKKALLQNFELLQLMSWTSYYLGILYQVEPDKIPFVDWFKAQLAKK